MLRAVGMGEMGVDDWESGCPLVVGCEGRGGWRTGMHRTRDLEN
jgi:hypothetical protein